MATGLQANPLGETWVPIQTWNLILMSETPISWFLSLDGTNQIRFWKGDIQPNPPEPPPVVGQTQGWLIPNTVAQAAGLIPTVPTPPGGQSVAQQAAAALASRYNVEVAPLSAPLPPEGP